MIKKLDGKLFNEIFQSASNNLQNNKNRIDALNVFPVPDGDTGTNMSSTAKTAADAILNKNTKNLGEITKIIAQKMLFGARGNSGVILSQIFKGFSLAFQNKAEANSMEVLEGFKEATKKAYSSVLKPIEGTILTVIRETTEELEKIVDKNTSLENLFELAVNFSKKACDNTPNKLKILREVGVTDSGGEGLHTMIKGMSEALNGNFIKIIEEEQNDNNSFIKNKEVYDGEFGYCTEFILMLEDEKDFDKKEFEKALNKKAKSLVVVQDGKMVKVHGHTLKPGNLLNYGQKFGEFLKIKSENMTQQAQASRNKNVIVNESEEGIQNCGIISCNLGSGIIEKMKEFGVDAIIESGQTQNPSAQDLIDAINSVNAKNIFILPNNSNIFLAAEQAGQAIKNKKVYIIPTRSQVQGITAIINFSKDNSPKENKENMNNAIKLIQTGEITKATRNAKINNIKIKEGQYIGILDGKMSCSKNTYIDAAKTLIKKTINEDHELITIYYGNDATETDAIELQNFIEAQYEAEIEIVNGNQPNYHFIISFE